MDDDSSADTRDEEACQESSSPPDVKPCLVRNGRASGSGDGEDDEELKGHLLPWCGSSWQDGTRKSAFQPYRQPTTVLTNLQRGNIQTQTPVLEPIDVSLHHRAGQGEVTVEDLQEESDVDIEDANGLTPLHWASSYGQLPTVQLLLRQGAVVDQEGPEGETALHLAASGGHHDTLRLLLAEGAGVNHVDENSNTALMYAAHGDHPHCVNELLLRGADLTMVNLNGDTAYGVSITRGSKQAQAVFENHLMVLLGQQR